VMGPAGSGKSTVLPLAAGLDAPTGGEVLVGGQSLAKLPDDQLTLLRRRKLGIVFQAFNLLDVLSAEENVALPLLIDGVGEAEAGRRAREGVARVGLTGREGHLPSQLSGGGQQRVAIARAPGPGPLRVLGGRGWGRTGGGAPGTAAGASRS